MSEREELLGNIHANPCDLVARMVFADFLDESGLAGDSARAAFIRTQCELERILPHRGGGHRPDHLPSGPIRSCSDGSCKIIYEELLTRQRERSPVLKSSIELHERMSKLFEDHGDDWIADQTRALGLPVPTSRKITPWRVVKVLTKTSQKPGWPYTWHYAGIGVDFETGWSVAEEGMGGLKDIPPGFRHLFFTGGFADELWVDPTKPFAAKIVHSWRAKNPTRRLVLMRDWSDPDSEWSTEFHLNSSHFQNIPTVYFYGLAEAVLHQACEAAHQARVRNVGIEPSRFGYGIAPFVISDLFQEAESIHFETRSLNALEIFCESHPAKLRTLRLDKDYQDWCATADEEFKLSSASWVSKLTNSRHYSHLQEVILQYASPSVPLAQLLASSSWKSVRRMELNVVFSAEMLKVFASEARYPELVDLSICLMREEMVVKPPPSLPKAKKVEEKPTWKWGDPLPVKGAASVPKATRAVDVVPPEPLEVAPPKDESSIKWNEALDALREAAILQKLVRLRLSVRPLHPEHDFRHFEPYDDDQDELLPIDGLARFAEKLASLDQFERFEAPGEVIDERGRWEMRRHLKDRVIFL